LPAHIGPLAKPAETPVCECRGDISVVRLVSEKRLEIPDALVLGG
jgi:hypothetical protein